MANPIEEAKQQAREYIKTNFSDVKLKQLKSPCEKIDGDNKTMFHWTEDPIYFTDSKEVYAITGILPLLGSNMWCLQKVTFNRKYTGENIEKYEFQHYDYLSDNPSVLGGARLHSVLDKKEHDNLVAKIQKQ
jgi:hypothetical protein